MDGTESTAFSQSGVTLTQYAVLATVSFCDGTRDRAGLLRHLLFIDSAGAAPQLSSRRAEAALDACLVNGWIKVLTSEDCLHDRTRWAEEPNQAVSESEYQEGNMDFTVEGAQLWNRRERDQAEANGKRLEWGIRYAWRFAGQVRVFSAYEEELRDTVEAIRTGKDVPYTGTFHLERMEGPFVLSEWWINRFVRLPHGYRMDIYCTLEPEEG